MKRLVLIQLLVLVVLVTIVVVPRVGFTADKVVTLRFSQYFSPTQPQAIIVNQWCKEVEKRTEGRVKVMHYPGGTLNPPSQSYDSVLTGVADLSDPPVQYTAGKFPLTEILDYPLGSPSTKVSIKLANAFYGKFKPKEFDEVKVMYFHACLPAFLNTKSKPVSKLEDVKGMKIKVGGANARLAQALGGIPVAGHIGESYDMLSRGVADAMLANLEILMNWKIGELIKYTTVSPRTSYVSTFVIVMNKDKWAAIQPQDQKIIEKINDEWIEKWIKLWETVEAQAKEYIAKRGIKVINLTPEEDARWAARTQPLFDEYLKRTKGLNLPGDEALKFARDFIKANSK
jgi:TRAP-type C4-dicarboxylate transport system substrate-binding protein